MPRSSPKLMKTSPRFSLFWVHLVIGLLFGLAHSSFAQTTAIAESSPTPDAAIQFSSSPTDHELGRVKFAGEPLVGAARASSAGERVELARAFTAVFQKEQTPPVVVER